MKISIISVGSKMPDWVNTGFNDYLKRFPKEYKIDLIEIDKDKTSDSPLQRMEKERQKILQKIPKGSYIIALDVKGKMLNTFEWSQSLQQWQTENPKICFLIGGPDGLSQPCLDTADEKWSLSLLTLPHALVRVILIEQLYRAYSVLVNHPYHR